MQFSPIEGERPETRPEIFRNLLVGLQPDRDVDRTISVTLRVADPRALVTIVGAPRGVPLGVFVTPDVAALEAVASPAGAEVEAMLTAAVNEFPSTFGVRTVVVDAELERSLLTQAQASGCDAIVVGAPEVPPGRGATQRWTIGLLATRSSVPVVIAPHSSRSP